MQALTAELFGFAENSAAFAENNSRQSVSTPNFKTGS
jgi:hypothetical protein